MCLYVCERNKEKNCDSSPLSIARHHSEDRMSCDTLFFVGTAWEEGPGTGMMIRSQRPETPPSGSWFQSCVIARSSTCAGKAGTLTGRGSWWPSRLFRGKCRWYAGRYVRYIPRFTYI